MEYDITTLEQLSLFAAERAARWRALSARRAGAVAVSLEGELGAGKTAFVKALAQALGTAKEPVSPTFVLLQSYPFPAKGRRPAGVLHHLDVYRLKEPLEQLPPLGFRDMLKEQNAIVCVEWGERVRELFAGTYEELRFILLPDNRRIVKTTHKS